MMQLLLGPNGLINYEKNEDNFIVIYWGGRIYYRYHQDDRLTKNIGLATMSSIGVKQKTLCTIFNVGRNTITRVNKIYKEKGITGLFYYNQGITKIESILKDFIIKKYIELKDMRGYQNEILKLVNIDYENGIFNSKISRSKMQIIIKEYKEKCKQQKKERFEEKKKQEELLNKEKNLKTKKNNQNISELKNINQPELFEIFKNKIENKKKICVDHGGSIISAIFLEDMNIMKNIPETSIQFSKNVQYTNKELAVNYVLLNAAKIMTVEQDMKNISSYEMGGILGRKKLPSLSLYRKRIPDIIKNMNMREVIFNTSIIGKKLFNFSKTIYIDGHFLPYYGNANILYDFNSIRRLAMHGREYYFVHDENGIPVFAEISDGYRKMKYFIRNIYSKLKKIYKSKDRELLAIFDRGGYSKKFCVEIADKIRFICWRSDAQILPKLQNWKKVFIEHEGNVYPEKKIIKMQVCERKVTFKINKDKEKVFREVWIKKGKKTSPSLTNDFSLSTEEVAIKLTKRWGVQENNFKKLKTHGIDKIHSYAKADFSKDYLYSHELEKPNELTREVLNPKVKEIMKKISLYKKRKTQIENKALKQKTSKTKKKYQQQLNYINLKIKELKLKKQKEPEKILLYKKLQAEEVERLIDNKKLFFDWLKIISLWSREKIINIIKPLYLDLRDIEKYVDSILNSRTYIYRNNKTLFIEFPMQHSIKKKEIMLHLCAELNKCKSLNLGLSVSRLVFSVRQKD